MFELLGLSLLLAALSPHPLRGAGWLAEDAQRGWVEAEPRPREPTERAVVSHLLEHRVHRGDVETASACDGDDEAATARDPPRSRAELGAVAAEEPPRVDGRDDRDVAGPGPQLLA